jgi:hypothetical protein
LNLPISAASFSNFLLLCFALEKKVREVSFARTPALAWTAHCIPLRAEVLTAKDAEMPLPPPP